MRSGVRNLELLNIECLIFWNFEVTNFEIGENELFDYFIYEFISFFFCKLLEHSKYLIINKL